MLLIHHIDQNVIRARLLWGGENQRQVDALPRRNLGIQEAASPNGNQAVLGVVEHEASVNARVGSRPQAPGRFARIASANAQGRGLATGQGSGNRKWLDAARATA